MDQAERFAFLQEALIENCQHVDNGVCLFHEYYCFCRSTRTSAVLTALAKVEVHRVREMPQWAIQPDADTPGLYLQCGTVEERREIMLGLGWREDNVGDLGDVQTD